MKRILLIDSRPEALDALAARLEGGAFSVRKAKRFEGALTEAKRVITSYSIHYTKLYEETASFACSVAV